MFAPSRNLFRLFLFCVVAALALLTSCSKGCSKGGAPALRTVSVTGFVTTPEGMPLEGVRMRLTEGANTTTTDANGAFQLALAYGPDHIVAPEDALLEFSPATALVTRDQYAAGPVQLQFVATNPGLPAMVVTSLSGQVQLPAGFSIAPHDLTLRSAFGATSLDAGYGFSNLPIRDSDSYHLVFLENQQSEVVGFYQFHSDDIQASSIVLAADDTALALVASNPHLGLLEPDLRRELLDQATARPAFGDLVSMVSQAWSTAPQSFSDYETFPHLYEAGMTIGLEVLAAGSSVDAPVGSTSSIHIDTAGGGSLRAINPYQVFYGMGIQGRPPVVLPGRQGLVELSWSWPPVQATQPTETPFHVTNGSHSIDFYKGMSPSVPGWLDPATPQGIATMANFIKSLGIALDVTCHIDQTGVLSSAGSAIAGTLTDNATVATMVTNLSRSNLVTAVGSFGSTLANEAAIEVLKETVGFLATHWDDIAYWVWQEWPGEGTAQFMRNAGGLVQNAVDALPVVSAVALGVRVGNEYIPFFYDLTAGAPQHVRLQFSWQGGVLTPGATDLPPVAALTWDPLAPGIGEPVEFDASSSFDDHDPVAVLQFRFDRGNDGSFEQDWSYDPTFTTQFSTRGNHEIALEARDSVGQVDRDVQIIHAGALDSFKIVLTWGASPPDLDSHLWTPVIQGNNYHVAYWQRYPNLSQPPYVMLDIDDVNGYGPETVWFERVMPGTYNYAVHRYSSSGSLVGSGAAVQVIRNGQVIASFVAPGVGSGRWWHVFDLDGATQTVLPVNVIQSTAPQSWDGPVAGPPKQGSRITVAR